MCFLDTRIARWATALLVTVHAACPAAEAGTVLRVKVGENVNEAIVRARALPKPDSPARSIGFEPFDACAAGIRR